MESRNQRQSRRGRPSAAEIRATLPEAERDQWCGVIDLAREHGVHKDVVRRAVNGGRLVTRQHEGVTLIDRQHAIGFFATRKVPR